MFKRNINGFINVSGAIIIAASIIAIAIILVQKPTVTNNPNNNLITQNIKVTPINNNDLILGNPNAKIMIVEYSDPSCGYCRAFHPTMEKLIENYGAQGTVAWVYRHFPLDIPDMNGRILHPNANRESQAIECARKIGGTEKGWAYLKKLYTTNGPDGKVTTGVDPKEIIPMAESLSIDKMSFESCLKDEIFKDKVSSDFLSGKNAGVNGTPTIFMIVKEPLKEKIFDTFNDIYLRFRLSPDLLYLSKDRKTIVATGVLPYNVFAILIDQILAQ